MLASQLILFTCLYRCYVAVTIDSSTLHTWWHDNKEYNDNTPVANDRVRASTIYRVQISKTGSEENILYDSFTYMSIPRGGREKWGYDKSDGAEFARQAKLTMSWSTFQYMIPVWITITLLKSEDKINSEHDIIIRPMTLNFRKEFINDTTIRVLVPYQAAGYRFSVEFKTKLFTTYNLNNRPSENIHGKAIHTEPRDALLIFAESILVGNDVDEYIPTVDKNDIHYVQQGEVNNLNTINQTVIYFRPGTYFMPWNYHAHLSKHVNWIYLAPGAYIKGAFQFESTVRFIKVTGLGVLSGEKYVYEADVNNNYRHTNGEQCWATCIKMLRFTSEQDKQQNLYLHGITVSEPPYHTFVVYGDEQTFRMSVSSYHQVGSWYWQTDGLEIYPNSTVENTFFHSNDDVLKIYHSYVTVKNIVIWKNENGPVIQWGWAPRTIRDVLVDEINIIHNRIWWSDIKMNTCIINSASHFVDMYSTRTADPEQLIYNFTISNYAVDCNKKSLARTVEWIREILTNRSFKTFSDQQDRKVTVGNQLNDKMGLTIENYSIGSVRITKSDDNWRDIHLGRLGFDADLWNNWDAV